MNDSFEFTLHSPLTKEDWNKISDAELEKTMSITFQTPQGRQVKYIKCDVLDKIRAKIEELAKPNEFGGRGNGKSVRYGLCKALEIIDKYKAESEIHCTWTDSEIAKSFIEDVEAVKDLLPRAESEVQE